MRNYENDASAVGRINAWTFAWNLAVAKPIIGGGFGAFTPELFDRYAPNPDDYHDSHSIYFEVLGEHGFVGLFLFLTLMGLAWRCCAWAIKQARRARDDPDLEDCANLARMMQVSLIGYAASGAFLGLAYFDLYYAVITLAILTKLRVTERLDEIRQSEQEVLAPELTLLPATLAR